MFTQEVTLARDEGIRADTTYEGVAKIKPARAAAASSPPATPASSPTARRRAWS